MTAAAAFAAYNESMNVFRAAARAYEVARKAHHAGEISDAKFFEARVAMDTAIDASDAAEAVYIEAMAAAVEETITEDIEKNGQLF